MDPVLQLLPIVGIFLVFYLLVIRPQSRRAKAQVQMQEAVQVGDEVMLTSGFFGTVHALRDDQVEVELAPGTVVTVARAAVGAVVPDASSSTTSTSTAGTTDMHDRSQDDGPSLTKRDGQEG